MYTSVYKDSTAFWPAASGTQCKAKIRVTWTWGERTTEGTRSDADSHSYIAQLAPQEKKKKKQREKSIQKEKLPACFHCPHKEKICKRKFYFKKWSSYQKLVWSFGWLTRNMVSMQIYSQKSGLNYQISGYGGNVIFRLLQNIPETEN